MVKTMKLSGREYVLLPRKRYEQLTAAEAERREIAHAHQALEKLRSGKLKTVPHQKVKRMFGM